ncbi:hypothetical protein JG687_00003647 [Phytophthora cactorum]|uniref:Uncharacterized protein n=2 Tax=Phytophthora cactorum TaxID=29920 RepID=A0A8T1UQY2_9STRA|nr:hypothetical protein JG687_00003647 [Phytophthora cactorum]
MGSIGKKTDGVNSALEVYSTNMTGMECDDDNNCYFYINTTDESIAKTVWSDYISPPGFEAVYFYYRSGMVQSWNKFCFQGGMIEVRAQLPGAVTNESGVSTGSTTVRAANIDYYPTWPGIWLMGNLGRAIFSASTSRMWPFTYIECNETNFDSQSQRIGPGMPDDFRRIADNSSEYCYYSYDCTTEGANQADVPTAYYFNLQDDIQAFAMVNASIAEGITDKACTMETCPGSYDPSADLGYMNTVTYSVEWVMGDEGYILWEIEGQPIFEVTADVLTNPPQNSAQMNPKKIMIEEPMYIIFNSSTNNAICDSFPMYLKIDYVRLYQDTSDDTDMAIGCDPDTHPTKQFIKDNIDDYIDDDNPDTPVSGMSFCDSNTDWHRHGHRLWSSTVRSVITACVTVFCTACTMIHSVTMAKRTAAQLQKQMTLKMRSTVKDAYGPMSELAIKDNYSTNFV